MTEFKRIDQRPADHTQESDKHMKHEDIEHISLIGQFAEFIAARWTSGFAHSYPITKHPAWNSWRARHGGVNAPWTCNSLSQAAEYWCWTEKPKEPPFSALAQALQRAIAAGDEALAEQVCRDIYRWGGVGRKPDDLSVVWLRQAAQGGRLTGALRDAVALLSPGWTDALDRFNADDLPMTSATTKLYAAAASGGEVAIYDGRVGAALGLLARQFLESRQIAGVPDALCFMWGAPQSAEQAAARTRDPSDASYRFPQLPNGARSHRVRAALSRRTNLLVREVVALLAAQGITATPLALERALFMIGYCVRPG